MSHYIQHCKFCDEVMGQCRCFSLNKTKTYGFCSKCNGKAEKLATELKNELSPLIEGPILRSENQLEQTKLKIRSRVDHFIKQLAEEGIHGDQELKYAVLTKSGRCQIVPIDKYTQKYFNWIFAKAR